MLKGLLNSIYHLQANVTPTDSAVEPFSLCSWIFFSDWVIDWFFRSALLLIVYFIQDRFVQWVSDLIGCMSTWNCLYLQCCNVSSLALGHEERCPQAECNTMWYHEPLTWSNAHVKPLNQSSCPVWVLQSVGNDPLGKWDSPTCLGRILHSWNSHCIQSCLPELLIL